MLRKKRLNEVMSTDTFFASERSVEGYTCAQVFVGSTSKAIFVYGMKTESHFIESYYDFMRENGIPCALRRDNAKSEKSAKITALNRRLLVSDQFTESHQLQQNPAESMGVKYLKEQTQILMNNTGAPEWAWYLAVKYGAYVHNK